MLSSLTKERKKEKKILRKVVDDEEVGRKAP
jgi:hypothetical protein